jgi:hypothetical protein
MPVLFLRFFALRAVAASGKILSAVTLGVTYLTPMIAPPQANALILLVGAQGLEPWTR